MNCEQANQIPLTRLLKDLGFSPVQELQRSWIYSSPLRQEKTPSFKVNLSRNLWVDFGDGEGGTVVSFVMRYYQVGVSEALQKLNALYATDDISSLRLQALPSFSQEEACSSKVDIHKITDITAPALMGYLESRAIAPSLARRYLKEIHYVTHGKHYFALCFENRSGGYEVRNKYFKGSFGKKDVSWLSAESRHVAVFEGFFDFLSALAWKNRDVLTTNILVLNSTALKQRALEVITDLQMERTYLYLDHDQAGRETSDFFLRYADVVDGSGIYQGYKDFNEFWVAQK